MKRTLLGRATQLDKAVDEEWQKRLYQHHKASRTRESLSSVIRRDVNFAQIALREVRAQFEFNRSSAV